MLLSLELAGLGAKMSLILVRNQWVVPLESVVTGGLNTILQIADPSGAIFVCSQSPSYLTRFFSIVRL